MSGGPGCRKTSVKGKRNIMTKKVVPFSVVFRGQYSVESLGRNIFRIVDISGPRKCDKDPFSYSNKFVLIWAASGAILEHVSTSNFHVTRHNPLEHFTVRKVSDPPGLYVSNIKPSWQLPADRLSSHLGAPLCSCRKAKGGI